jgi:hypothetical protein
MNFNRDSRFMKDTKRRKALRKLKKVDGKSISYEKFLRDYLRSMSFTYHTSGCNSKKYRKIMDMCESMALNQWQQLPQIEGE